MAISEVIDGIIDLIDKNMIARTNVVSNVTTGDVLINVENSFHYEPKQEAILIDYGYNDTTSPHYNVYERIRIKEVNNTHWVTLYEPIISNWTVADQSFMQKTIGHDPLYTENVLYGDREVIPTTDIAITVEPVSLSNEWLYIQGGLSEEYRVSLMIYGKDVETEDGMVILGKYTDALYKLMMSELHIDINNYESPLMEDTISTVGTGNCGYIVVEDTSDNREMFVLSSSIPRGAVFDIQDNVQTHIDLSILDITYYVEDGRNLMRIDLDNEIGAYLLSEYAVFRRRRRYFYDTRVDSVDYGKVQKGSAFLRAATLSWWGKEIEEFQFPQRSKGVNYFNQIQLPSSSSSSSSVDSSSSSSIDSSSSSSS